MVAMVSGRWLVFAAILSLAPFTVTTSSVINKLPGFDGDLPFKLETGYIGVEEVELYYYFVESLRSPSTDPLLVWFVGGPGCSAVSAFFFENGPLKFNYSESWTNPKLEVNPSAWTQELNVIYVDLPVGTGFSYSKTQEGYHTSDSKWVDHAYNFLKKWFADHPKFETNPFYIGGGSYSALTSAPLVQKVYEDYEVGDKPVMNIKGYVLASPAVDSFVDINNRVVYAHRMALVSTELYESMKANCDGDYVNIDPRNTKCVSDYEDYTELIRYIRNGNILEPVCVTTPNENPEILLKGVETNPQSTQDRSKSWCREQYYMYVDQWANDKDVRNALHIRGGTKGEFERCNDSITYSKNLQSVFSYHQSLANTNLRALIYCADLDMAIPLFSTQNWIEKLNLSISERWRAWFFQQQVAGYTQTYSKNEKYHLTFATVKGGGHVAQEYKPREVHYMIKRWFDFSPI